MYLANQIPKKDELAQKFLKEYYHHDLRHLKNIRYAEIKSLLIQEASKIFPDEQNIGEILMNMKCTLHNKEYCLDRRDVPEVLALVAEQHPNIVINSLLAHNLVLGNWTKDPPSYLRKNATNVCQYFSGNLRHEVLKMVRSAPTCRRSKPNRLGHSVTNPYPGPACWTESYAQKRLEINPKKKDYVRMMHSYTVYAQGMNARLQNASSSQFDLEWNKLVAVHRALGFFQDANRLADVREAVNYIFNTDGMTIQAFAATNFSMKKVRKGWTQHQIGQTTVMWQLNRADTPPPSSTDDRSTTRYNISISPGEGMTRLRSPTPDSSHRGKLPFDITRARSLTGTPRGFELSRDSIEQPSSMSPEGSFETSGVSAGHFSSRSEQSRSSPPVVSPNALGINVKRKSAQ